MVRLAPCSVMTVGPEVSIVPERPLRIVGALDLDQTTDRVIESTKRLCDLYAADPYFVHVVSPPVISGPYDTVTVMPTLVEELLESAREGMKEALIRHQLGERAKSRVLEGRPDQEIRKYGEEVEADLLVVSTHGRRGLSLRTSGFRGGTRGAHREVPRARSARGRGPLLSRIEALE